MLNINEYLDSTLLKTPSECNLEDFDYANHIKSFVQESIDYDFKLVMLRIDYVDIAIKMIKEQKSKTLVGTVVDFPFGKASTSNKIELTKKALRTKVDDIDCVVDYEGFKKHYHDKKTNFINKFKNDIYCVSDLVLKEQKTIKWIIETGALTKKQIEKIVMIIKDVFYDKLSHYDVSNFFIKTSTGYYKGTGAKLEDIKLISSISEGISVKASGGIYTKKQALKMINNGSSRIGTSKALDIFLNK
tara:strand:+ start:154 stop:888 length:735 start_codon:yes stop_codon:yes gene_type:complete